MCDMRQVKIYVFMVIHALCLCLSEGYRTFSMRGLESCANAPAEINLGSIGHNSSGILIPDSNNTFVPGLHCVVFIRSPLSYDVLVSIRYLDLHPLALNYTACHNYLEVSPVEDQGTVRLCGYSYDEYEFKSLVIRGRGATIVFHTSDYSSSDIATFQLTFTAVRKGSMRYFAGNVFSKKNDVFNGYCIWKGLTCDGHNNCGDLSDEVDKYISQCGAMTPGESLGVILITIVGSLTLIVIAAYFRGPKITQQIERLSQCRRDDCPETNPSQPNVEEPAENNSVYTVGSRQDRFRSGRGLLSSYSYSEPVDDPPPPYEDVVPIGVTVESAARRSNMT